MNMYEFKTRGERNREEIKRRQDRKETYWVLFFMSIPVILYLILNYPNF